MRNSVYAGLCLGLLLTFGVSLGVYFYITAQNRASNTVLEEEVADLPAQPTPAEDNTRLNPLPTVHFDEPSPQPDVAPKITPEDPAAPRAEVKLDAPKAETTPKPADKPPLDERIAKLLREKLGEGNTEIKDVVFSPVDPADLVDFSATVSGTVVDTFGLPVAGAGVFADVAERRNDSGGMTIALTSTSAFGMSDEANKVATSDAQGNFSFAVNRKIAKNVSISVSITARAKSFASSEPVRKSLKSGDDASGVVLKVRMPGSFAGIVSTPEGQPIAGATVSLAKAGGMSFEVEDSDDEIFAHLPGIEIGEDGPVAFASSQEKLSATTDAGGAFSIDNVPEGDYQVRLKAPGFKAAWEGAKADGKPAVRKVNVKAGQANAADGPLHMLPTTSLRAVVRGTDGNALGARVTAELYYRGGENAGKLAKKIGVRPDKDGVALFGNLPAGDFDVVFKSWGYEPSAKAVVTLLDGRVADIGAVILNKKTGETPEAEPAESIFRVRAVTPDKR